MGSRITNERFILGAGSVKIRAPRVDDRRPEHRFTSKILPPYMRRSPRLEEAVPVLYLRGLSTGDFSEALEVLLGSEVAGFSATTVTRLLKVWQEEYKAWRKRSLAGKEYVYIWADGVYFNIRLEEDRLACLVIVGVLPDGRKEVIALEDGYRESTESWASVLRDLKRGAWPRPFWPSAMGTGLLGCSAGRLSRNQETTLLEAQDRQRAGQAAQAVAGQGQGATARDHVCARSGKRPGRDCRFSRKSTAPAMPRRSRR